MICRRGKFFNRKVKCVNFLLKHICKENGYFFIDISNIEIRDLWKDGIHLLESCKTKLAENFTENNVLKNVRLKNSNKVIISHIDINSLKNNFELLTEIVRDKVDLLMIFETKLDSSFPNAQFYMKYYSKPYRFDRNSKGGGIILYVREDIPSKLLNSSCIDHDKEYFLLEINLRKQKWLIICNYNPHNISVKKLIHIHQSMIIFFY